MASLFSLNDLLPNLVELAGEHGVRTAVVVILGVSLWIALVRRRDRIQVLFFAVALIGLATTELSTTNDLEKRLTTLKEDFSRIEAELATLKNRCANATPPANSKRKIGAIATGFGRVLASSEANADHRAEHGRLHYHSANPAVASSAWVSGAPPSQSWLQVTVATPKQIVAVATQGRHEKGLPTGDQWVTKYKVQHLLDGLTWHAADGGRIFDANTDRDTVVEHRFANPFVASIIRLEPIEAHTSVSMRCEVYFSE